MKPDSSDIVIPDKCREQWQDIINIITRLFHVAAGLIMRLVHDELTVFLSSETEGNPYRVGKHIHIDGSGLYCETVIKEKKMLIVTDALSDSHWKNSPGAKNSMISYLGFPLLLPNGNAFGTLCVFDNHENKYSSEYIDLIRMFGKIIEQDLQLIWADQELGGEEKNIRDYVEELKTLRGMITICSKCKKIRDDDGFWNEVEEYVSKHSDAIFTHSLCKDCLKKLYGNEPWFIP